MKDSDFNEMNLQERIDVVNKRFSGIHPDRITKPSELLELIGKTIYFVLSPFGQEQNVGNTSIYEWVVDRIIDKFGNIIEDADQVSLDNEQKYLCIDESNDLKALSIKDFNILPNTYNNHAAFTTKEGAESYMVFRKLQWAEDNNLTELVDEYDFWITDKQIKETQEKA